jgi:hypothetical protein
MSKHYRLWKKVEVWVAEDYYADDDVTDVEMIKLASEWDLDSGISGRVEWTDMEWADEYNEMDYDSHPTYELYNNDGNKIWDNTPIEILREQKLNQILK